jgi:uncharacterized protein (TIGR02217 family)
MSNEILPKFPGISITEKWTPMHNTLVRNSATRIETRATYEAYPLFKIALKYELLRAGTEAELQAMVGFFLRHQGRFHDFLHFDSRDYLTLDDSFGVGDGVTKTFRLWRTWGGSRAPISAIKQLDAVKVGGVVVGSGLTFDVNTGKITFAAAPAEGAALTWSGQYYWRVRFADDALELEQFLNQWWQAGKIELLTVKTV